MAIIVNDTLAVASAAAASSKKRRQSFAGHEHGVVRGRVAEALAPKRRGRFDRDRFELWRPQDRNGVAVRALASDAAGEGQAGAAFAAGESTTRRIKSFGEGDQCSELGFRHASTELALAGTSRTSERGTSFIRPLAS